MLHKSFTGNYYSLRKEKKLLGYFQNFSLKCSLGNQNRFFYGIIAKIPFLEALFFIIPLKTNKQVNQENAKYRPCICITYCLHSVEDSEHYVL